MLCTPLSFPSPTSPMSPASTLGSGRRVALALVTAAIVFLLPLSVYRSSPAADVSLAPSATVALIGQSQAEPWDTRHFVRPSRIGAASCKGA